MACVNTQVRDALLGMQMDGIISFEKDNERTVWLMP